MLHTLITWLANFFEPYEMSGFFKSASAFMNILVTTLKIVAEYYPCRLFKAFVIDPPPLFSYLWKVNNLIISVIIFTVQVYRKLSYTSNAIGF